MRFAQRQMELRRLGNQLPVIGEANALCEVGNLSGYIQRQPVACCVFCPGCVRPRIHYRSSSKIRVV